MCRLTWSVCAYRDVWLFVFSNKQVFLGYFSMNSVSATESTWPAPPHLFHQAPRYSNKTSPESSSTDTFLFSSPFVLIPHRLRTTYGKQWWTGGWSAMASTNGFKKELISFFYTGDLHLPQLCQNTFKRPCNTIRQKETNEWNQSGPRKLSQNWHRCQSFFPFKVQCYHRGGLPHHPLPAYYLSDSI